MSRRIAVLSLIVLGVVAFGAHADVSGVVITREGAPVIGATVSAYALESSAETRARLLSDSPQRAALASGETNKEGAFRLKVDSAVFEVEVRQDGFAPASLRATRDEELGAIMMRDAGTRTGRVSGPGGAVPNARVIWHGRPGGELVAVTDGEGRYTMPDPAEWAVSVTVLAPGHAIFEEARTRSPLTRAPDADVRLEEGVTITGRVVAADGKAPVAGVSILVDGWPLAVSAEDGSFTAPNAPARWTVTRAIKGDASASRTKKDDDLVLRLEKAPRLSGVVRDAESRTPLAGVEVWAAEQGGSMARRLLADGAAAVSVITDAKGAFSFDLPTGSYEINARMPGYSFTGVEASLTPGARVDRLLPGARLARLTGTVLDEDGQGIAAASVARMRERGAGFGPRMMVVAGQAWTAPDGRFVLRNIEPADSIRFEAEKKGFPSGETDRLSLSGGETKGGVVITIPRGIEVVGTVTDANGIPLSGVAVTSAPASPGNRGMFRVMVGELMGDEPDTVMTSGDGRFSMQVKKGLTDFSFKLAGYATRQVSGVEVAPGLEPIEATLDEGAVIEGRVVRAGGAGVEDVNVAALSESGMQSAITLPDGSFVIQDLTPGPMMLMAGKEEEFIQQMRRVTAPDRDVVIEVPPGETVSGRVVDKETGEPVKDFQAGIQNSMRGGGMRIMGPPNTRSFRDESGMFVLENVPTGPLQLLVTAPGYVDQAVPGLVVEEGKPLTDLEIELDRGTTITGQITGPDGRAVQGASVRVESEDDAGMPRGFRFGNPVDAEGSYRIEAVAPGERTLVVTARGYLEQTKTIDVSGREMKVDVTLGKGATVTGTVVSDMGAPVPDAYVGIADDRMFGNATARTDSAGNFRMEGIEPGRYTFEARKSGMGDGILEDFDVRTGAPVRIVMPAGATITGSVRGIDASEYARVQVVASADSGSASAMVSSSGSFRIDGAPTGSVRVFARMTGFGGSNTETKTVEVQTGGQAVVDLEFRTDTSVSGRVTKNGRTVDGAMVRFSPKSAAVQTRATATTDSRGNYEVTGLAPGDYDVTVIGMQDLSTYTEETSVRGSTTFDIDIETARVDGRVVDADTGRSIPAAEISLEPKGQAGGFLIGRNADSDPAGNFVMEDVAPGSYTARASKSGYGQQVFDLEVGRSGASGVEFKLASTDGARVRVVDGRDGRALDAFARVEDLQGRVAWEGSIRGSDKGTKIPLAAGSYRITVWASGYAGQPAGLSAPSQDAAIGVTPGGKLQIDASGDRARSGRLLGGDGREYFLSPYSRQGIRINPGTRTLDGIAPGSYSLVVYSEDGSVEDTLPVTITEGRTTTVRL
jgi:protocatechuate 3,4-dioxygenase beta subunit